MSVIDAPQFAGFSCVKLKTGTLSHEDPFTECLRSLLELVALELRLVVLSDDGEELYSKTNQYFVLAESVKLFSDEMLSYRFYQYCNCYR